MRSSPSDRNAETNTNNAEFSSLTVAQLKTLLKERGSTVGGTKQKLITRLSNLAEEQKHNKISNLSSMAKTGKRKMSTQAMSMPPPSLKQQVREASESQKANGNAKTSSNGENGFSKIYVPPNLIKRLNEMGISEPTPIQKEAIPLAIKGRDVMGLAQTGTGKTLAFGLPLVSQMMETNERPRPKAVRGLVLAPTRELANQIAVQLGILTENTPIKTFVVVGGQNIKTQINKLQSGTDLLVATPGRLIDLMDRGALSLQGTTFLVLDEADLMLDMGFLPSLKKIAQKLPKKRQTMLFSATMSKDMNTVARSYLQNPARIEVAKAGKTAEKVTQELHYIAKADKTKKLLELLGNPDHKEDRSLVFGRTKHGMEKLSKKLIASGFKAGSM
jgi:ATP-dependent RNA helicase RhlE